ncbi:MAG: hypothetical protein KDA46_00355 [Parvularculaceae bacterium]|nr:hypothetical protein [Parvularculaceae bacterium]
MSKIFCEKAAKFRTATLAYGAGDINLMLLFIHYNRHFIRAAGGAELCADRPARQFS